LPFQRYEIRCPILAFAQIRQSTTNHEHREMYMQMACQTAQLQFKSLRDNTLRPFWSPLPAALTVTTIIGIRPHPGWSSRSDYGFSR
jgi:hypothetical protein